MPLPRPAPGSGRWWVVGVLGVVLLTAAVIWYGVATQVGAVTPQVVGYAVLSDAATSIDYQVNRPEGTGLSCTLTALDDRHGRVGTAVDQVPPGSGWARRQVEIRTTHRAVTAVVDSCVRVG